MDIVIGKVPDNVGNVCTLKDFNLSNDLIHVSFGSANPRGGGDSVAAANIILETVDLHLRVFGDEVNQFRSCVTPTEALNKAYSAIVANVDAAPLSTCALYALVFTSTRVSALASLNFSSSAFFALA
jgi:hypothetical protein